MKTGKHFHFMFGKDATAQCEWLRIVKSQRENQECNHENRSKCTLERIRELAVLRSVSPSEPTATPEANTPPPDNIKANDLNEPEIFGDDESFAIQCDQSEASVAQIDNRVQPIEDYQSHAQTSPISTDRPTRNGNLEK